MLHLHPRPTILHQILPCLVLYCTNLCDEKLVPSCTIFPAVEGVFVNVFVDHLIKDASGVEGKKFVGSRTMPLTILELRCEKRQWLRFLFPVTSMLMHFSRLLFEGILVNATFKMSPSAMHIFNQVSVLGRILFWMMWKRRGFG